MNLKQNTAHRLVLGSGSAIRKSLLHKAGVSFITSPPNVDEGAIKQALVDKTPQQTSAILARKKALSVMARPHDIVIGSDQILEFQGRAYDKVSTMEEAKARLQLLCAKEHFLVGTTVLARGGSIIWEHQSRARMVFRGLSGAQMDAYLHKAGPAILASVGCYEVEGLGIGLFEHIEGDYFSILGLPIIALLTELHRLTGASPW